MAGNPLLMKHSCFKTCCMLQSGTLQKASVYLDSSTTVAQVSCRLRWCHTDLGANVLSWPRLIQEDKRFSQLGPIACGLSAEHFDGVLAHHLLDSNWTVHHVTSSCLYDHSPSPQVCALPQNLPCRQRCTCRCWPGEPVACKHACVLPCIACIAVIHLFSCCQWIQLSAANAADVAAAIPQQRQRQGS